MVFGSVQFGSVEGQNGTECGNKKCVAHVAPGQTYTEE